MIKPPQMMLLFYITGEVYTKSGIDSFEPLPVKRTIKNYKIS